MDIPGSFENHRTAGAKTISFTMQSYLHMIFSIEVVLHRFILRLGLGAALLAAGACAQGPQTLLTQAAARNDVVALRQVLLGGHHADERGDSWTALIWASRSGSIDAINVLLDSGADVNLPG